MQRFISLLHLLQKISLNMKTIYLHIIFIYIFCFITPIKAQKNEVNKKHHNINLGFEFGADAFFGDPIKPEMVRENRSSYNYFQDYNYYCGLIPDYQEMNVTYIGVKPELFICKNRIGLSSGLRLSRYSTNLDSDRDYFLWLLHQDDVNTEYVKINDITQNSYYLGIPLEFRFFPNKRELPFQIYFKAGSVFNYRIHTNNKVNFQNKQMNINTETVGNQVNNSIDDFNAYMFFKMGFKIGSYKATSQRKFPYINIELVALNLMLTDKASSFMRTNAGLGFQLTAQIPLGKNVPIGSR